MSTTNVYRVVYSSKSKLGDKAMTVTASSVANAIAAVQAGDSDAGAVHTVTQTLSGINVGS